MTTAKKTDEAPAPVTTTTDADELAALRAEVARLQSESTPPADDPAAEEPAELNGRLVLASGAIIAVPAEGVQIPTSHYDENLNATVPVVSSFVLA